MTVSSGGARRRLSQVPVAALAAGAVAVLCGVVAPAPQARAQATPCAVTEVTVVVAGQGTGCAPAGLDGLTTLRRAGFSVTMVQTQPGFICRINGTPASDPCVTTPPADSYWAYYHAPLGGTWQYSTLGASARTAAAGTVEGWAFGDGARPGSVPTAPRTQVATTRPSSSSTPPRTTTPSGGNQVTRATTRPPAPTAVDAGPPAGPGPGAGFAGAPAGPDAGAAASPPDDAGTGAPPVADAGSPAAAGSPADAGSPAGPAEPARPGQPAGPDTPVPADLPAAPDAAEVTDESGAPGGDALAAAPGAGTDTVGQEVLAQNADGGGISPWPYVGAAGFLAALVAAGAVAARRSRQ